MTDDEAMQRAAEIEGYAVDTSDMTDRFENDYQPNVIEEIVTEDQKKKSKKSKHNVKKGKRIMTKKERQSVVQKKVGTVKPNNNLEQSAKVDDANQAASDVLQDGEKDKENYESVT